ncbi:PASTA domain-containing protein [Eubacteriales bacterium OttesenSCG-928-K08]|nr:PASTA domain-containing protein [Eubacteriales bacterium OttesenSCG-928-K08]
MGAPDIASKKRLTYLLGIIGFLFLLLLGRLFYVQVIWGPELQEKALLQWTLDSSLSAERGRILDRDGQTLAQSGTAYKVEINPQRIAAGERMRIATELANVLDMDYEYVLKRVSENKQQIILKRQISREQMDELISYNLGNGVTFGIDTMRYYPMGTLLSQTLGFTTVDGVGQEGLERSYDKYLAGEAGRLITETDRDNMPLAYGSQEYIEPVDGCDIVLTTDSVVQSILEKKLEEALEVNNAKSAQGLVMNPKTGEILAVSTKPDYDPNAPPRSDLETLQQLVKQRVVCDAYEPGSTFKVVTLSAAIDSGAMSLSHTFDCGGSKDVNGERIKCWRAKGHGHQTLEEAVRNSCNPAFMTMALSMGKETFYDYIYKFGFGSSTESGLTGESSGIVIHQKYVRDNNIARIGFGQSIAVTPIQLATAVSAAINGGELMQPYIVKQVIGEDGEIKKENQPTVVRRVVSKETSATVRTILESVVAEGSGKNAQIAGYRVGGKTGTAQKYVDGKVSSGSLIASFVGFAPADDPEYLCLILVDEPQVGVIFGSTVAAPFVKDVLQETLLHYGVLPEGQQETVLVPNVVGMSAKQAAAELKKVGINANFVEGEEEASVVNQVPFAGDSVIKDSDVLLYTTATSVDVIASVEETMVTVPNVMGKTPFAVYNLLTAAGLELRMEPEEQSGIAVRQKPEAGTQVPFGEKVTVDFSLVE